jgi:hypothetical protein
VMCVTRKSMTLPFGSTLTLIKAWKANRCKQSVLFASSSK